MIRLAIVLPYFIVKGPGIIISLETEGKNPFTFVCVECARWVDGCTRVRR